MIPWQVARPHLQASELNDYHIGFKAGTTADFSFVRVAGNALSVSLFGRGPVDPSSALGLVSELPSHRFKAVTVPSLGLFFQGAQSPWYNHTGWLGVKHLLTKVPFPVATHFETVLTCLTDFVTRHTGGTLEVWQHHPIPKLPHPTC